MLLHRHASENLVLDLEIDGKKPKKVLLKEVQHDTLSGCILHADFVQISMTKRMRIAISITLVGEAVGVTHEGGVLEHLLRELEVECLPMNLVEELKVDISDMKIGDTIQVSALEIDPKLTVLTDSELPVASVAAPRIEEEPEPEEVEAVAEGAEPEVIGEEKKEEEEDKDKDKEGTEQEGQKGEGKGERASEK